MDNPTAWAMLSAQLTTATMLAPHLTTDGLHELRGWLRHPDTAATSQGTTLLGIRAALLEYVCARLTAEGLAVRDYFVSVGDVAPDVPDTPEAITA